MKNLSYTAEFKEQALVKAFSRSDGQTIGEVAAALNINTETLKYWMKTTSNGLKAAIRKAPRAAEFTRAEQLLALHETHGLDDEAQSAWCRQRGLFVHHLAQWHREFCAVEATTGSRDETDELRQLRQTNAQLQRELNRKDKALAEAAALLILQKKFQALWAAEGE